MLVPANSNNLILSVHLVDDNGDPITGKAYNTAGLAVSLRGESEASYSAVTLVDGTLGTYVANSWKEVGLGEYQFCPANAAIVPGRETKIKIVVDSNAPLFDSVQARLPIGSGSGDRQITFAISSGASAVAGARVTVLSGSLVVSGGTTDASGGLVVYVPDGAYTVRVAASPVYETLAAQSLTVTADASVAYSLTAVVIPAPSDPALCAVRFVVEKCGVLLENAQVTATLRGDNSRRLHVLIQKCVLTGTTNASGYVDLVMLQSSQFIYGSGIYDILVRSSSGETIHERAITIPSKSTAFAADLPG